VGPWLFAGAAGYYLFTSTYFDHVEPAVVAISAAARTGLTVYHDIESPEIVALPYGPWLFILQGATAAYLGQTVLASKLLGVIAGLGSIVLAGVGVARLTGRPVWQTMGWLSFACLSFGPAAFWTRADPLILLGVSAAIAAVTLTGHAALAVFAVAVALTIGCKATAGLYLLPIAVLMWERHGLTKTGFSSSVGLALALAPNLILDQFDLMNYAMWLGKTTQHGFSARSIGVVTEWVLVLAGIALASRGGAQSGNTKGRFFLPVLLISILAVGPVAAKVGAGPVHFLPLIPALVLAVARSSTRQRQSLVVACEMFIGALVILQSAYWIPLVARSSNDLIAEARALTTERRAAVAFGYTGDYRSSFVRATLAFEGGPVAFDPAALMDRQMAGVPVPQDMVDHFRQCRIPYWILPKGGTPFALPNAYDPSRNVFPVQLTGVFQQTYRIIDSGLHFDVWGCTEPPASSIAMIAP
jgi:hypothetical protein